MRIIGGRAKGRILRSIRGSSTRPTSDRVKESLFNILPSIEGACFLDLFAGTGNIGLEAMSRGAAKVVFIEKSRPCSQAIKKNILLCGGSGICSILEMSVERGLKLLAEKNEKYDIIFADPPYRKNMVGDTLNWIKAGDLSTETGITIIQHSKMEMLGGDSTYHLFDQRIYGDTIISFLEFE
jgi:16S rRNA (guanine966-N2)-methyltransferase